MFGTFEIVFNLVGACTRAFGLRGMAWVCWLGAGHLGTLCQSSTRRDEWSAMGAKEQEVVPLHAGFDVVFRGFHRRQVIEHIDNLEDQLRYTGLDRAEAMAQAADLRKLLEMTRKDLEESRSRVERLELSPSTTAGATERLHRMLLLAEEESAELRLSAERDVASLRKRTEVELAELRAEVEEQARQAREAAARRAAELDQREVELERRATELEADHVRRRAQV